MSKCNKILPKSLWGFYIRHAIRYNLFALLFWFIFTGISATGRAWFPYSHKLVVQLLENAPVDASAFFARAIPLIIFITAIEFMYAGNSTLRGMMLARWDPKTQKKLSEDLLDAVHSQSMSFWTGRMAGQVNSQIGQVVSGFMVVEDITAVLFAFLVLLLNLGLIFSINVWVAVIFLAALVCRVVWGLIFTRPMKKTAEVASESESYLSGRIVDSISNFSVVKLFAGKSHEKAHLNPSWQKWVNDSIQSRFMQRVFWSVPDYIWGASFCGVLIVCIVLFAKGQMSVADVVYSMMVYDMINNSIDQITGTIPDIIEETSSANHAYQALNSPIDVADVLNAPNLAISKAKIELKNVSFKYKNKWVLRNLNLTINPGEKVGLVGPSGAGKTTLVHLLMRLYDPTEGQILVDGQDIHNVAQDSLRRKISFIPQDPTMFNRTLFENIAYGNPNASRAAVRRAAVRAAADTFIMETEKKYDSLVGDRGIKLSGGQRQRISIARAFLKDAPILILDEATSALDSETELAIQESFDELTRGRTTVAIAHRLSTLRNMDRIVVLKNGNIVEQGKHSSLLRRGGEYSRLWKMQSGGFIQKRKK